MTTPNAANYSGNIQVTNYSGNIIFDSNRPGCFYSLCQTQGKTYAFVQALDIGMPHARLKEPMAVRYWGRFHADKKEESILEILDYGNSWPDLNFPDYNRR